MTEVNGDNSENQTLINEILLPLMARITMWYSTHWR